MSEPTEGGFSYAPPRPAAAAGGSAGDGPAFDKAQRERRLDVNLAVASLVGALAGGFGLAAPVFIRGGVPLRWSVLAADVVAILLGGLVLLKVRSSDRRSELAGGGGLMAVVSLVLWFWLFKIGPPASPT